MANVSSLRIWFQYGVVILVVCSVLAYLLITSTVNQNAGMVPEEPIVYSFQDVVWRRNFTLCNRQYLKTLKSMHYFLKGTIPYSFGNLTIYIYNPQTDLISNETNSKNVYKPWVFNTIYKYIQNDTSIGVIDIGAKSGIYSLPLARLGRKVVAVETIYQHIQHLCASVIENKLTNQISIVYNALNNNHLDVPLTFQRGWLDFGYVKQRKERSVKEMLGKPNNLYRKHQETIKTATLNDFLSLAEVHAMKKVFITMDVQGYEQKVIEGSNHLFSAKKLIGVYMKWYNHGNTIPSGLLHRFNEWGYEPFYCNKIFNFDNPCQKIDVYKSGFQYDGIIWLPRKKLGQI
ncbi:uncharacterized protein LOC127701848 [Mytilus californianus]|uniref:uncharacterized protein LOC127701848 n=1 Tax=Mytilus californianus TaxID=6549 RepID=UPI00224646CC|nr:uncharacterized protein LOC127701848 [Mytilus californianus]